MMMSWFAKTRFFFNSSAFVYAKYNINDILRFLALERLLCCVVFVVYGDGNLCTFVHFSTFSVNL